MDTKKVAKKYQESRDKAIAKKISETIELLDREELKHTLLNSILHSYTPKLDEITKVVGERLDRKIEELTTERIELLISKGLKKVFTVELENKIAEMIDDELDTRFKDLIKYHDEY